MPEAKLHDSSAIEVEVHGDGPTVLLPVNPRPVEGVLDGLDHTQAMQAVNVLPILRPWLGSRLARRGSHRGGGPGSAEWRRRRPPSGGS